MGGVDGKKEGRKKARVCSSESAQAASPRAWGSSPRWDYRTQGPGDSLGPSGEPRRSAASGTMGLAAAPAPPLPPPSCAGSRPRQGRPIPGPRAGPGRRNRARSASMRRRPRRSGSCSRSAAAARGSSQ